MRMVAWRGRIAGIDTTMQHQRKATTASRPLPLLWTRLATPSPGPATRRLTSASGTYPCRCAGCEEILVAEAHFHLASLIRLMEELDELYGTVQQRVL